MGGYFSMNKKIMSLSFMLSFLFGTCASQSYALPKSGTKGQAMTDYVQISRQDFNQLQSQIAQLQNALNDFAKKNGRSSQKRGFLVSAVYSVALIILLAILGSMAYVFYDYNCNFKGIKENEELGLMNYLLSKFKFKQEVTDEKGKKTQKITDMDKWLRDLNSWTQEMQIWIKGIKDLNIEGIYKDLLPLLTALKKGEIFDYMLDNFKFSYEEEVVVTGNIINNDNNDKNKDDSTDEDEKIEKEENNKNKRKKTITLRELLKNPQFLFEGELRRFIKAFGKGNLLNYILDSWKISDKPLRVMLKPVLDLMGENSLEGFLNFKIKVGKEEEKTIKEIFVNPVLEIMAVALGSKAGNSEKVNSMNSWKDTINEKNIKKKLSDYGTDFGKINERWSNKESKNNIEQLLKDIDVLTQIQEFYEKLIVKNDKNIIFKEEENTVLDVFEIVRSVLMSDDLSKRLSEISKNADNAKEKWVPAAALPGLCADVLGVFGNVLGFELRAQLRPQNQFSLYKMVVRLNTRLKKILQKNGNSLEIEKKKRKNSNGSLDEQTLKSSFMYDY